MVRFATYSTSIYSKVSTTQSEYNVPSGEHLCDFRPAISQCHMSLQDGSILLFLPGFLANVGVKVIVPSFTTLLANTTRKIRCNQGPFLGPVLANELDNLAIFLGCPGSLDKCGLENLLPAMEALHLTSAGQMRRNKLPVLGSMIFHSLLQSIILLLGPLDDLFL
jgi:hypothetical protein